MAAFPVMPGPEDKAMVERIRQFATGVLKGATTDLLGAPVDIINTVLGSLGVPVSDKPIGGSKNLRELTGNNAEDASIAETLGTLVNPENAAKAMIIAAARVPERAAKYIDSVASGKQLSAADRFTQTGVYADKDQKMKTIISDRNSRANPDAFIVGEDGLLRAKPGTTLGQALNHPDLYAVMPELRTIPVEFGGVPRSGSMAGNNAQMTLGANDNKGLDNSIHSVLLHETQHAIQTIEGFGRGGNTRQFLDFDPASVQEKLNRARKTGDVTQIEAADRAAKKLSEKLSEARTRYMNLPGEQEARYTQETRAFSEATLANDIAALLRKGDTPQTFDTKPIRPLPTTQK
jgi:hypothetical protein